MYNIHKILNEMARQDEKSATPPATPPQPTQPVTEPTSKTPTYEDEYIKSVVMQNEGLRLNTYLDTNNKKTIGIGHNLDAPNSINTFQAVFGEEQGKKLHSDCRSGTCGLNKDQAKNLFDYDFTSHRDRAVELVSDLHTFPKEVQAMVVDATYRGHPGPKFIEQFNAGNYTEAAKEYLNRKEYTNPKRNEDGSLVAPGVITRLEGHHKVLKDFADKNPSKSSNTDTPQSATQQQKAPKDPNHIVVSKGDTLSRIAKNNNTTIEDIMKNNPDIVDPNKISAGQKITLPKKQVQDISKNNPETQSVEESYVLAVEQYITKMKGFKS